MRTLPLVPFMRERLLALKEEQQENRRLCGRSYIKEYLEYVCVNEIGDLIKPHYFSTTANIYAHLDYSSKLTSADAMLNGLGFAQN